MAACAGAPVQLVLVAFQVPVPPLTTPLPVWSAPSQNWMRWPAAATERLTWFGTLVSTVGVPLLLPVIAAKLLGVSVP